MIGGLASIMVKTIMGIYVFLSFKKMIFKEEDKNTTEYGLLDLNNLGAIPYNQTDIFNFFVIKKQIGGK